MHKSRLGTLVVDCEVDNLDTAIEFWSGALGGTISRRFEQPGDENYALVETYPGNLRILLQKVLHPSRVHLDIEADDIEAEVSRLEELGAKRVEKIREWWVMEAPTGHRFCVVRVQREGFEEHANEWS